MKFFPLLSLFFIISFTIQAQVGEPNFITPPYNIASAMATADINGDGRLDLVVRVDDPGPDYSLVYFESYGEKDYIGPKQLLTHEYDSFNDFFIEDVNDDGYLDVLSAAGDYSRLYLGDENLEFTQADMDMGYFFGGSVTNFSDQDNDGDKDLLALFSGGLYFYPNEGAPNYFSDYTSLLGSVSVGAYQLTDGNMDGYTDVFYQDDGEVIVRAGSATGDFSSSIVIDDTPITGVYRMAIDDVDADGFDDIITLSSNENIVGWYRGLDADWNFAPHEILFTRPGIERFYLENLDEDAELEILVHYNNTNSDKGLDRYNLVGGTLIKEETIFNGLLRTNSVTIFDADADGDLDIVASHDLIFNIYNSRLVFMENVNDNDDFTEADYIYSRVADDVLIPLDMDNDGDDDLIVVIDDLVWYAENLDGQGNYGVWKKLSDIVADYLYDIDYDDDGDTDLIISTLATHEFRIFENIDNGGLVSGPVILDSSTILRGLKIIDFDLDGDKDFVYMSTTQVFWKENLGTTFAESVQLTNMEDPYIFTFNLSDFDGDGDYDILVTDNNEITYNENEGGVFGSSTLIHDGEFEVWTEVYNAQSFDFDQDGDGDLIYLTNTPDESNTSEAIRVMKNVGTNDAPIFEEAMFNSYYSGGNYLIQDINYDGWQDVISVNIWGLDIMLNNAGTLLEAETVYDADFFSTTTNVPVITTGDANSDGSADLFIGGIFASFNPVWFGNLNELITLSGITYADNNNNNEYDGEDTPLANQKITLQPNGHSTFSNALGQYGFTVENGTYTLVAESTTPWTVSTENTVELTVPSTILTSDFGYQADSDFTEGEVFIQSAPTRCGFTVPFWLTCVNTGTNPVNGSLSLSLDANSSFISALIPPDEITATELTWNFTDLEPTSSLSFPITLEMPGVDLIGTELDFSTTLNLTAVTDGTTDTATEAYNPILNCAYDPNDKQVSPARALTTDLNENYTLHTEDLDYTIRFQNTGTDTAFTVVIRDMLSEHLDLTTLRPTSASHSYTLDIDEQGQAAFTFDNILLPDSLTNELESHGYIAFTISPKSDLPEFTIVDNTGGIYFDFNPPIITNTVRNIFVTEIPLAPVSDFNFLVDEFSVQFTDQSQNEPQTWYWDFGDGNFDTTQSPMHQFEELGTYEVCLTTQNDFGSNTTCKTVDIETNGLTNTDTESYELIPNPTEGETILHLKDRFGPNATLYFFDMKGVQLSLPATRSVTGFSFDVTNIANGFYFFQVIEGEKNLVGKFVVAQE